MTFAVPGYQIERLLGYGSQAEVWAARSLDSGEQVAIKRIAVDSSATAQAARAEAALLAALDHPNLIGLRAYLAVGADIALVMELAAAGSLADLLRRRVRLSPAEVVATISPVAAALAHAHDEGVLHADVSAANILFTETGQPKLADLGIARLAASRSSALGAPGYLDPVVAAGGAPGAASDVFALGAVALHALTGAGPWQLPGPDRERADTAEQLLAVAAAGQVLDLPGRLARACPELAEVIARALQLEPHRRGTAAELALDLRAAVQPAPVLLTGGRIASSAGRHSLEHRQALAAGAGSTALPADLTQVAVTAARPPRDVVAEHPRRRRALPACLPRSRPLRTRWLVGLAGVLATVVTGSLAVAATLPDHAPSGRPAAGAVPSTAATGAAAAASSVRPAGVTAKPSVPSAPSSPIGVLQRLDELRSAAYSQRRPSLLGLVYRSPQLLAEDTAQLARTVPAGCRLLGLHTSYRQLTSAGGGANRLQLQAIAAVSGGRLECAGTSRLLGAAAPVKLAIGLFDDGRGYRIVSEAVAG